MDPREINLPRCIIAAPMSGSGKTTLSAGLIAAFVKRQLRVAPFKCGPDYIDPSYHTLAAGRPCTNLDAWMLPEVAISSLLVGQAHDCDLALLEGVMGLFDGYAGDGDSGSTAHIARLTQTPVIIVLDVRAMARTAAALIQGLRDFDPRVRVAGVILNRAGSSRHTHIVKQAIEGATGLPVLGSLVRDETLHLPERHLGLVPTAESDTWKPWLQTLVAHIEDSFALDRLLEIAHSAPPLPRPIQRANPTSHAAPAPVIAVAADQAFSFRYQANIELLEAAGAHIAFFSPLYDLALPKGTRLIYLSGGFPELYAAQLSANHAMRSAILHAARARLPIYAECGGLMYLTEELIDADHHVHTMVGALPGQSTMTPRLTLGYRTVEAAESSWLWQKGENIRGHEFHYSTWQHDWTQLSALYTIQADTTRPHQRSEGGQSGNLLASYIHLHFLAKPELARRFVAAARAVEKPL